MWENDSNAFGLRRMEGICLSVEMGKAVKEVKFVGEDQEVRNVASEMPILKFKWRYWVADW